MSAETWTILRVLDSTRALFEKRGLENPRLDAEVLIADALELPRVMLYAHFDRPLAEVDLAKIRERVKRRGNREPVAYITRRREFWSLELEVDSNVLIPRPDTESLVEVAVELARAGGARTIADVGTGSGAIALALAKELPEATIHAFDISAPALSVATKNVERHQLAERVRLVESDLLNGATGLRFDLIVANLPYVAEREYATLASDVRDYEPALALLGGEDGLAPIRRLIGTAPAHLEPGGALVLEAGATQLGAVAALLEQAGFEGVQVRKDYGELDRVAFGRWPRS